MVTMAALALAAPAAADPGDGRLGGIVQPTKAGSLCPAGVGATGFAGNLGKSGANPTVATVTARCRGGVAALAGIGTFSGPDGAGTTMCGTGQVAVGITGREGAILDQLAVRCRPSDLSAAATTATGYGGAGGNPDGPYDCPANQWLRGVQGSVTGTGVSIVVQEVSISCIVPDSDGDGIPNATDNCVAVANSNQLDTNPSQFGDACATKAGDGRLGGPPAIEPGTTTCSGGAAVTGISGNIGSIGLNPVVNTVRLRCDGGLPAVGGLGTFAGGPNGSGASNCAAGEVAVGMEGREGDFVDRLILRCRSADLTGPTTAAPGYGGSGGSPDGPYDCPAGARLVGFDGTMVFGDQAVRELRIRCALLDTDGDGVANPSDNCITHANADQSDVDGDGIGDVCDPADDRPVTPTPTPTPVPLPGPGPASVTPATRLTSTVSNTWVVNNKYGVVKRLVINDVASGATVTIRCAGKGCPFKSRRFAAGSRGTASATKAFAKSKLRIGTVLEVRITKPDAIGRVVTFTLKKRAVPKPVVRCLPVGATKPQSRC
jgi:hypothetical protein